MKSFFRGAIRALLERHIALSVMWVALALGIYFRLVGLGRWPLAVDEFFITKAVQSILDSGLPTLPCGGYYTRGILYQYILLPFFYFGMSPELATRFLSVLLSLGALAGVYRLARATSGTNVAVLSVIVLSLSLWEIEFARFGRMYAAFQMVFVWYLYFLHRVIVKEDSIRWVYLLSVIGVLVWEGGFFLLLLNLLIPVLRGNFLRPGNFVLACVLLLVGVAYLRTNFMRIGMESPFPADVPVVGAREGPPPERVVLATTLPAHPLWLMAALPLLGFSAWMLFTVLRSREVNWLERIGLGAALLCALFNLFGLAVSVLALVLLLDGASIARLVQRPWRRVAAVFLVSFGFWLVYGLATDTWKRSFPTFDASLSLKKLLVAFLKFPNILDRFLYRWFDVMPLVTAILLLALAAGWVIAVATRSKNTTASLRFILISLLVLVLAVGTVPTKYTESRYTFFLYPVVILGALLSLERLANVLTTKPWVRDVAVASVVALLMVVGEDHRVDHLLAVDSADVNFRMSMNDSLARHFYLREDYRTPAEIVNLHLRAGDTVIITALAPSHYLEQVDLVYRNHMDGEFVNVSCDGGTRAQWTGSRLLYREEDLFEYIDSSTQRGDVWLIASSHSWRIFDRRIQERYSANIFGRGLDGVYLVYRITGS